MSLTRRQFLVRAGIASVVGPAVLATGGTAFAHFGASASPESPEGSLRLLPRADVNLVGSEHTVTARLSPRREGEIVSFVVASGPNVGDGADVPTSDSGRASFSYTGDGGVGLDVISARARETGSGELSETVTKEWVEISAITGIEISPLSAENAVGDDHEVWATIAPRVGGVPVRFEVVSGPNSGLSATVVGDSRGRAHFAYVGDGGPGTDVIAAWVDANDNGVLDDGDPQALATKEWLALSTITGIELSPATSVNELGDQHELRATITPQLGNVPVRFDVVSGPNAGLSGTAFSDNAGRASFAYVGDGGLGMDLITAWVDANENGVLDDGDPQAVATKEWVESVESPESPESPGVVGVP